MSLDPGSHASSPDARQTILFVCAANVCRSPMMEFLTSERLHAQGVGPSWHFSSAGASAAGDQEMCAKSAAALTKLPGGAEFAEAHRSRPLTRELVDQAALILVTTRKERSAVAKLSPAARERTFTMIEAARLAEAAAERGDAPWLGEETPTLDRLVAVLHARRGTLAVGRAAKPPRKLRSGRRETDPLDVPDVHTGGVRSHTPVHRAVAWSSSHLADAIVTLAHSSGGELAAAAGTSSRPAKTRRRERGRA